jgi:hypothetical protein
LLVSLANGREILSAVWAPTQVFEVGDTLWLKFDPQQMAAIEA